MIFTAGLDEAGRGPLAGPVCAASVILPPDFPIEILNDSKKLSEKKRLYARDVIKEKACWGISFVDHEEIDRLNILRASLEAMRRSWFLMKENFDSWCAQNKFQAVPHKETEAVADGTFVPEIPCRVRCEIKADAKFHSVMAASILAKTARDELMIEYDKLYPEYGYAKHKGYPTPEHKKICRLLGPSPIQRHSFKY